MDKDQWKLKTVDHTARVKSEHYDRKLTRSELFLGRNVFFTSCSENWLKMQLNEKRG